MGRRAKARGSGAAHARPEPPRSVRWALRWDPRPEGTHAPARRATVPGPRRGGQDGAPTHGPPKRLARYPEGPAHRRCSTLRSTLERTIHEFREDHGTDWAAALTYYSVLSVVPGLIALISLVGLVADPTTITERLTDPVTGIGPGASPDLLRGPIADLTAHRGAAGILLVLGLLAALWITPGYLGAFSRAANVIYEVEEGRPFLKRRPLQMCVTLLQVLLMAVVVTALVVTGPAAAAVGSALGVGDSAVLAFDIVKWPVLAFLVLIAVGLLYYASPNAKLRGFRSVLPGAVLAVALWAMASGAFAAYVANFGSYNRTYGMLGGVFTFLVWMWITNVAILLGAQFNAECERSRQFAAGVPEAERELQIELRQEPKHRHRSRTA